MQSKIESIIAGESAEIYTRLLDKAEAGLKPHQFIDDNYNQYLAEYGNANPSLNGWIFEYLICETLATSNITPFYYQATFRHVPNAAFDITLYDERSPVVLTAKVSLRERYKQADLEGLALRNVYRAARNYLITLSEPEAANICAKIAAGDIVGIDRCILANAPEYDELLDELNRYEFHEARSINPLSKGKIFPA